MKIKIGKEYICIKKVQNDIGEITFKKGCIYKSEQVGALIYESTRVIFINVVHIKNFIKLK
jgi:hypothetical protein